MVYILRLCTYEKDFAVFMYINNRLFGICYKGSLKKSSLKKALKKASLKKRFHLKPLLILLHSSLTFSSRENTLMLCIKFVEIFPISFQFDSIIGDILWMSSNILPGTWILPVVVIYYVGIHRILMCDLPSLLFLSSLS